jgi:hypothetical protein
MTDEEPSALAWHATTLGYVVLAAFASVVLVNATMSFFLERIVPGVGPAVAAALGAYIGNKRRRRSAPKPEMENTP